MGFKNLEGLSRQQQSWEQERMIRYAAKQFNQYQQPYQTGCVLTLALLLLPILTIVMIH